MGRLQILRRLGIALLLLCVILVAGVLGYTLIERWSYLDSLYMTVITVATVGFREVHPLSTPGRLFTIALILSGIGALGYAVGVIVEFMVEGHLLGMVEMRRVERKLSTIRDHFILCGFGRVGEEVAKGFVEAGAPFVVIEKDEERAAECDARGYLCLEADATDDEVLKRAGIQKANGLVGAVDTDADNVFVVLSARNICPDIFIVARANHVESEAKLAKAGADRVLSPAAIGGRRMANLLVKPVICDYVDFVTHGDNVEFRLEEMELSAASELAGKTIGEAHVRDRAGTLVLAVRKPNGDFNTNPSSGTRFDAGDTLVVIGTATQIDAFRGMV